MPVTIKVALHGAALSSFQNPPASCPEKLLQESCPEEYNECREFLQSSFDFDVEGRLQSSRNGFVLGTIQAYSSHQHLKLRPEDVWFAILTQLSCYINKHVEEFRGKVIKHERSEGLELKMPGTPYTAESGSMARKMSLLLKSEVVVPELTDWIMPNFTTTRQTDEVIASILMMGVPQKDFVFTCRTDCGIPSVTLLGERRDWEKILGRLEKLKMLGEEPTQWYHLLQPVLSRIVKTFEGLDSEEVVKFWQEVVRRDNKCGTDTISGWITAFCLWDEDGNLLYQPKYLQSAHDTHEQSPPLIDYEASDSEFETWEYVRRPMLRLDRTTYGKLNTTMIPSGYASMVVTVMHNGRTFDATMTAGSVGIRCTSSGDDLADGQVGLDTFQPESGWWMFEKDAATNLWQSALQSVE